MNYKEVEFILFILCLIALLIRSRYLNRYGQAELEDVLVIDDRVITISSRSNGSRYSITRIQFFNSTTGRSEGIKLLGWEHELAMSVNGILWMFPKPDYRSQPLVKQNVIGIDSSTRKVVFSAKNLKRNFNIPRSAKFSALKADTNTGRICFTTEKGFCHEFDCNTLSAANSSHKIVFPLLQNPVGFKQRGNLSFNKISHSQRYQLNYNNTPLNTAQSFINPGFICVSPKDPKSALFIHYDSLNRRAKYFISNLNSDGRLLNNHMTLINRYDSHLKIIPVLTTKEQVVFATKNAQKERLFAVDCNSCIIKWQVRF